MYVCTCVRLYLRDLILSEKFIFIPNEFLSNRKKIVRTFFLMEKRNVRMNFTGYNCIFTIVTISRRFIEEKEQEYDVDEENKNVKTRSERSNFTIGTISRRFMFKKKKKKMIGTIRSRVRNDFKENFADDDNKDKNIEASQRFTEDPWSKMSDA